MSRVFSIALVCVLCLSVVSEGYERKRRKRFKCAEQIDKALKKYKKERYNEVKTILTEVKYQCSGNESMDTVLYYLGMAHLNNKSPLEAKVEFERLAVDFASSSFSKEAQFRIGHCSYLESNPYQRDQSKTHDAIRELTEFIDRHPQSQFADSAARYVEKCLDKLAEKELDAARFYERVDRYESAIVYYRNFIQTYSKSKMVPEAKLSLASSLVKVSRPAEAVEVLDDLLSDEISDEIRRKATTLRTRAAEKAGETEEPQESGSAETQKEPVTEQEAASVPEPLEEPAEEPVNQTDATKDEAVPEKNAASADTSTDETEALGTE